MGAFINMDTVELKRLYDIGLGMSEIGRRMGVSYNTVRNRLLSEGVVLRRQGLKGNRKIIPLPIEEIKEARGRGMTYAELGRVYGVDEKTIRNRIRFSLEMDVKR